MTKKISRLNLQDEFSLVLSRLTTIMVLVSLPGCGGCSSQAPDSALTGTLQQSAAMIFPSSLSAVWANEGGDKVTRDEVRASTSQLSVLSEIWDGNTIHLNSAKNEIVNFNLVLEASQVAVSQVSVKFSELTHTSGVKIQTTATDKSQLFDWTHRPIELFYVRYLPIKGLSILTYEHYDERHIPEKLQRPYWGNGYGTGGWEDRPNHDKEVPDVAVPLELVPHFTISKGTNQAVWGDIYIPKDSPAGSYTGNVNVYESGNLTHSIPLKLKVYNFTLPDRPTNKTMVYLGDVGDWSKRYLGKAWPTNTTDENRLKVIRDRHFMMVHRHKISVIDSDPQSLSDHPSDEWIPRLNGSLFTAANGYAGPGVGIGNDIYSIGTYGAWSWNTGTQADMWAHTDAWETWFQTNSPDTERFLYLTDEPRDLTDTHKWTQWMTNNPGIGSLLSSMVTNPLPVAAQDLPYLNIITTGFTSGLTTVWQNAMTTFLNPTVTVNGQIPKREVFSYNGQRPYQGSFCTDDEGVALRELGWVQYKHRIARWFYWQATYYTDFQSGRGTNNVFENATTFGQTDQWDASLGETGWNHTNGDGLLIYPGTDKLFPNNSYETEGPMASLRLKYWRRGMQDADYLALARAKNAAATDALVAEMVPKSMWEYNADDPSDPTWTRAGITYSLDPDDWEEARQELADIITSP